MLKVKQIDLGTERYGDGYECTVTFQAGEHIYNTVKAKLTPEATREVVELAISRATSMLTVETADVQIAGEFKPIPLIDEAPAPEFAEVDEAPAPVLTPEPEWTPPEPGPVIEREETF